MEQPESVEQTADEIARWLIEEARLTSAPLDLIDGFCRRLVDRGVSLWRLCAEQRLANPLASAWGMIWTRDDSDTHEYLVPPIMLSMGAYYGGPFKHVIQHRRTLRRRLIDLDPERDHEVLHEMAAAGGTDLALPLEYGDGSVQGLSMVSDGAGGFADWHLERIERLRQPLASALEPTAMRRSSVSLLRTFLGDGPADAVLAGAIRRGDRRHIEAAILLADLRGFTAMSERSDEADLFAALDRHFEVAMIAGDAERNSSAKAAPFLDGLARFADSTGWAQDSTLAGPNLLFAQHSRCLACARVP
jgi:adenylate cyclase